MNSEMVFERYRNEFAKVIKPYLILRILKDSPLLLSDIELSLRKITGQKVVVETTFLERLQKEFGLVEALDEDSSLWDILPGKQIQLRYRLTDRGHKLIDRVEAELLPILWQDN